MLSAPEEETATQEKTNAENTETKSNATDRRTNALVAGMTFAPKQSEAAQIVFRSGSAGLAEVGQRSVLKLQRFVEAGQRFALPPERLWTIRTVK